MMASFRSLSPTVRQQQLVKLKAELRQCDLQCAK